MATAHVTYANSDKEVIAHVDLNELGNAAEGLLWIILRDDEDGNPRGALLLPTRNFRSIKFVPDAEDDK